jgi:hypothetical protein
MRCFIERTCQRGQHHGQGQRGQQRVDAIEHAAVAGQQPLESLKPALRLISDSTRSPTTLMAARNMTASSQAQP